MATSWVPPSTDFEAPAAAPTTWSPPTEDFQQATAPATPPAESFSDVLKKPIADVYPDTATSARATKAVVQAAGSMLSNTAAPIGAFITSAETGTPYANVRKTLTYTPSSEEARGLLGAISNAPVLKQVGQVIGYGGQKLSDVTGGAISPDAATDAINTALLLVPGAKKLGAIKPAEDAAGIPSVARAWTTNAADSLVNKYIVNNAWAQQIGESGAFRLTQPVLNRANARIGAVFDYIRNSGRQYAIQIDPTVAGLSKLAEEYTGLADHPIVKKLIDDIQASKDNAVPANGAQEIGQAGVTSPSVGTMDAEQLGNWSSRLGKAAKSAKDYELRQGLWAVKDNLEDLIQQGLSDSDKQIYANARGQYRALHGQLLARVGNINSVTGDVNAANMANFLQKSDVTGYTLGNNVTAGYQAARFGQAQAGVESLGSIFQSHNLFGAAVRAARQVGVPIQWAVQRGPQGLLKALGSNTAFTTALANELRAGAQSGEGNQQEGGNQ